MSTPNFPVSVNVQEGLISASLNASLLFNFLVGIYTMVYTGTMYLYLSRKAADINRRIVLSAISVLYLLCISNFILQWYFLDLEIVINGDTRESIFISTLDEGPAWWLILNGLLSNSLFLVSDALLIWRCYHVWGQSFRATTVPLILFLAEFGLFVPATVLRALFGIFDSNANADLFNSISSALTFVSLGTTMITTFLIGYRIHYASRLNGSPSKRLFNRIVVLVIESAAAYSLVLLLQAISTVVPTFTTVGSPWIQANFYLGAVLVVVAGLAPTVLVARIALTNPNNTVALSITHISGLEFGSQPQGSGRSGNVTGEVHALFQAVPAPMGEVKESSVDGTFGGYQA